MTIAAALADDVPATPPRPPRPLSTWALLRTAARNSLAALDEELFETLVVRRRYGLQTVVFVSDPAGVRQVLVERFEDYPRPRSIRRVFAAGGGGASLFSTEGAAWRRHRDVAAPAVDPRAIEAELPALVAIAEAEAEAVAASAGAQPIDVGPVATRLAGLLFARVAAGGDPGIEPVLASLSRLPRRPRAPDLVPLPGWLAALARGRAGRREPAVEARLLAMLEARRSPAYGGPPDMLLRLARGRDRGGAALPLRELRDGTAALVGGGGATRRALTWLASLLAFRLDIQEAVHAELDGALGRGPYDPSRLAGLPLTRRVVNETLRLYPPVPAMLREAATADVICGVPVPRGAIVAVLPYVIHRHRRLWRDPDRFDPGRFEEAERAGRPRLAFLPFSAGPRVCVASAFATTQILVAASALLRRVRFRPAPGRTASPAGAFSLYPEGGLWLTLERR